jgi:integrase
MLWLIMTGARRSEILRATWGDRRLGDDRAVPMRFLFTTTLPLPAFPVDMLRVSVDVSSSRAILFSWMSRWTR